MKTHWTTENVNFLRDSRNRDRSLPQLTDDDGNEIELPTHWGVCPTCNGAGKHVSASIDCNGLSDEDFADDPDFAEDYRAGRYDVTCTTCGGRTTIQVVDYDRLTPAQHKLLHDHDRWEAEDRAYRIAEARMGC